MWVRWVGGVCVTPLVNASPTLSGSGLLGPLVRPSPTQDERAGEAGRRFETCPRCFEARLIA